jgi:DNA-binding MarR family transcriptional regulator
MNRGLAASHYWCKQPVRRKLCIQNGPTWLLVPDSDKLSRNIRGRNLENLDREYELAAFPRTAMIAMGSEERQAELAELVRMSGCRPMPQHSDYGADYLLADLCSKTEPLADSLSEIVGYLQRHRSTALVWIDMPDLEAAYAILPQGRCHFLIDASDVEAMPILTGAFGRGGMDRLQDRSRERELGSLHRISDELAEFARTLAKMADSERKSGVSDKPVSFRPAPVGGFQAFPTTASDSPRTINARTLRDIIKIRRLRDRYFSAELFADPAWDILLDLKAAAQEGQKVSVSSLCIAAAVPPTTALRWITAMTESGMLVRRQDPDDARRVFIDLSEETNAKLDDYFAATATRTTQII